MRTQHMLDLNCTVMATLIEKLGSVLQQEEFCDTVDSLCRESQVLRMYAGSLSARASRISQHVSHTYYTTAYYHLLSVDAD